ncbi:MAG: class I SAM-dependent methyltransferase, partial [Pseudomonadota bacterium]
MQAQVDRLVGDESRSREDLRRHYEVEKEIATRLKAANRAEREVIYRTMYDELFEKVPNHSRLNIRETEELTQRRNRRRMSLVGKFISKDSVFLEFAPGDCRFASEVCKQVAKVYGVDISDQAGVDHKRPDNFELIVYDGYNLDLPPESVDVVFSDQLLEHLHPEDTQHHFEIVKRILKPNGVYVFRTPHRYSGPWDVSRYFADEPE